MKVIYGISSVRKIKTPVLAMGVFDGVHRGHREILRAAVRKAKIVRGASIALTFWPHPQKEGSLYSLEHRLRLIEEMGIDLCVVVNFTTHFSAIRPEHFIKDILVKRMNTRYVYIGSNFRFGRDASGGLSLLKRMGRIYGFKAEGLKIIKAARRPISSTLIRGLIRRGDIGKAQRLLGRPVIILGTVIRGTALGRILGFPTANIDPHHEVVPAEGIYAVRIILNKNKLKGVCYIGRRPTIGPGKKVNVEVHIFDIRKNLYGKYMEIQFVKRLRPDRKFPSLRLLALQIQKDTACARKLLR